MWLVGRYGRSVWGEIWGSKSEREKRYIKKRAADQMEDEKTVTSIRSVSSSIFWDWVAWCNAAAIYKTRHNCDYFEQSCLFRLPLPFYYSPIAH